VSESVEEFFAAEAPEDKKGKPLYHLAIRSAVNLRQLLETETIEFRHFPGTLDEHELETCFLWCREYLNAALHTDEPTTLLYRRRFLSKRRFPTFPKYVHWMEERYKRTVHDGSVSKEEIKKNIQKILKGEGE
jgi:hypothetical protein